MSDIVLAPAAAADYPELMRSIARAFGQPLPFVEHEYPLFEPRRSLRAFVAGEPVGSLWALTMRMRVPGAFAAVAGVTGAAVSPVHRRRGILAALMTRLIGDIHDQGQEAVAALWASEPVIYGRFGFGLAAPIGWVRGERAHVRFPAPAPAGVQLRMFEPPQPADLTEAYDAALPQRPGGLVRDQVRWQVRLGDAEELREGAGPLVAVRADVDGHAEGYVLYRVRPHGNENGSANEVAVVELVAATARARAALWHHVAGLDLTAAFTMAGLAPDDPLFHLVADPRTLSFTIRDGLYVRLVDVGRALADRAYAHPVAVTMEVVDNACPWNARRWRLDVSPDGAVCSPTARPADLTLSAAELGAAYLGGPTLRTLAGAGRVDEHTPGSVDAASRAFAGTVHPVCYEVF